jgi:hypothetical protein
MCDPKLGSEISPARSSILGDAFLKNRISEARILFGSQLSIDTRAQFGLELGRAKSWCLRREVDF